MKRNLQPFFVDDCALRYKEETFIVSSGEKITYGEFLQKSWQISTFFKEKGWKKGDRIGIFLPSSWGILFFLSAFWRLGVVVCPINFRLPQQGIREFLLQSKCKAIVTQKKIFSLENFPKIETFFCAQIFSASSSISIPSPIQPFPIDFNQESTILLTSGSSGLPKLALHSLGNHYYNALGANENIPLSLGDLWLASLPLYHVGGLAIFVRCLLGGATIVFPDSKQSLEDSLQKYHPTHLSLVPTQLYRLVFQNSHETIFPSLKIVLVGGGATSFSLLEKAVQKKIPIMTTYGSTEMASQITTVSPKNQKTHWQTSGKLLPYRELKISKDGEILVRGKTLFKGYLVGEKVDSKRDEKGWFSTGDLGKLDEENNLSILGRKDNLFISGGENIQPEEIEYFLEKHPTIIKAIVVPVPHAEYGARPVAFLKLKEENNKNIEKIKQHLRKYLPNFKIPKYFFQLEELPNRFKICRKTWITLAKKKMEKIKKIT